MPATQRPGRQLFERLLAEDRLRMSRSFVFDLPAPHKGRVIDADRLRGMMLGLAIGDALGNTSESLNPTARQRLYGEIRDYLPNHYANDRCVGLPSDDTQLSFWTLAYKQTAIVELSCCAKPVEPFRVMPEHGVKSIRD